MGTRMEQSGEFLPCASRAGRRHPEDMEDSLHGLPSATQDLQVIIPRLNRTLFFQREFCITLHPLLDWRTGLDMVRLALDPTAKIDLTYPYWATLIARIADPYFSGLGMTPVRLGGLAAGVD